MPRELTSRREILDAIATIPALSPLLQKESGTYLHELDKELCSIYPLFDSNLMHLFRNVIALAEWCIIRCQDSSRPRPRGSAGKDSLPTSSNSVTDLEAA